jgi:parvulin-like peptidyl-prolyl isomerase
MKVAPGTRARQAIKIAIAFALSLLGLALLPVLALPYSNLDWVNFDPVYREAVSGASSPLTVEAVPGIPCAELPAPGETWAAEVNGQAIGQQAYARELDQFSRAWESLGNPLESAEGQAAIPSLRRQVLDLMIDDVLVQQAAVEAGIEVSNQELQDRMAEEVFQGGGPELFHAWLEETGQTWQEFERDVCQSLLQERIRDRVTAGTAATDEQNALQALTFQQWLTKRREAAKIERYADTSW